MAAMVTDTINGRVAIVTGAAWGIGCGHALEFARQGYRVMVNDLGAEVDGSGSSTGPAGQVVEEIRALGGTVRATARVTGMYDKGSGALVSTESTAVDPATGETLVTSRSAVFIRGEGGDGGPGDDWQRPGRGPDRRVTYATRPEQARLYRLSGDRNPLHSDPAFAARAGFPGRSCTACAPTGSPGARWWRTPRTGMCAVSAPCPDGSVRRSSPGMT